MLRRRKNFLVPIKESLETEPRVVTHEVLPRGSSY